MNYKNFTAFDFERIPRGGKINARRLDLDKRTESKVFVFSERPGVYQCILDAEEIFSTLPEISGVVIKYEGYIESGNEMRQYILLECSSPAYLKEYTEIIKDVLSEFDSSTLTMAMCVKRVIAKWRHFLAEPRNQILTEEEILGLLGELILLQKIVEVAGPDSIAIWNADLGEEDFIGDKSIIEVKSSLQERHLHVINGIDQLRIVPDFEKYLLSLLFIRSTGPTDLTLPNIVGRIVTALEPYPADLDSFRRKLKIRGYDLRDGAEYSGYSYTYVKGGYFLVDKEFPRLTSDNLSAPLSPRVSKIRYTLDLEGLPNSDFGTSNLRPILSYS